MKLKVTRRRANGFVPRRGRPTAQQVEAIERTILATAQSMFLARGYAQTTMDAVAAAAGISKVTLYARYPTKAELFQAIATDRLKAWHVELRADVPSQADIGDQLLATAMGLLDALRSPEIHAFDNLIMAESSGFPEIAKAFYEKGYRRSIDLLAAELSAAKRVKGKPAQDAQLTAASFIYALVGWFRTETSVRTVSRDECRSFCRQLVALYMQGRDAW